VSVAGVTAGPKVGPGAEVAVNMSVGVLTIKLQDYLTSECR
jgi:hypothetical protein